MSQRHLIECHCILPIYKNKRPVMYHKFSVYSKIDEKTGKVIPKYVNCNNCGVTHYVNEYCKSQIKAGKEDILSARTIDDVRLSIPEKILDVLVTYKCTVDVYEEIEDVIDNDLYPRSIVLNREIINDNQHYKVLEMKSNSNFKIQSEIINTTILME